MEGSLIITWLQTVHLLTKHKLVQLFMKMFDTVIVSFTYTNKNKTIF